MFTGIIEAVGEVESVQTEGGNRTFTIRTLFRDSDPVRVDQSISHDGVCLTVTDVLFQEDREVVYRVTAVEETLSKTHLSTWTEGSLVNVERCMKLGDRLDGHLVQGHVDAVGFLRQIEVREGSWYLEFSFPGSFASLLVGRGSICVNGVSLTVADLGEDWFAVTIIPFTWEHTQFKTLVEGAPVNLEFDIIGKYLLRKASLEWSSQNA